MCVHINMRVYIYIYKYIIYMYAHVHITPSIMRQIIEPKMYPVFNMFI